VLNRRAFIGLLASATALGARGQQAQRPRRIGILGGGTVPKTLLADEMARFGWIEGQNVVIDRRSAEGDEHRARDLASELVRGNVDVIVSYGAVASLAARDATRTIPIVSTTGDPVLLGLATTLAHPGGNVTGTATIAPELAAKRLELLHALLPAAIDVAELVDPANEYVRRTRSDYERTFRALGLRPIFVELSGPSAFEQAFDEMARRRAQALIVRGDPVFISNAQRIIGLATQLGLPTMTEDRRFVEAGGLASYAFKVAGMRLHTAAYVDKILRGARPGDLAIEQPTEIELVLNLKTAKALGIAIPQSLLDRADDVIR
jgi:putative ABC transport system substrate-binding protein